MSTLSGYESRHWWSAVSKGLSDTNYEQQDNLSLLYLRLHGEHGYCNTPVNVNSRFMAVLLIDLLVHARPE
jgi:hypothetical protein